MKSLGVQGHFYCAATHFSMFEKKSDHRSDNENVCSWKKSLFWEN
jgi:hypothetical protein